MCAPVLCRNSCVRKKKKSPPARRLLWFWHWNNCGVAHHTKHWRIYSEIDAWPCLFFYAKFDPKVHTELYSIQSGDPISREPLVSSCVELECVLRTKAIEFLVSDDARKIGQHNERKKKYVCIYIYFSCLISANAHYSCCTCTITHVYDSQREHSLAHSRRQQRI